MKNSVKIIFAFTLGVAAGSVATWKFVKEKYEHIAQEEIDSVKEVYSKKLDTLDKCREAYALRDKVAKEEAEKDEYIPTEEDKETFEALSERYTGKTYNEEKGGSEFMDDTKPYIIPPEEFGENDDYERASLIYYEQDGVLTDDMSEPIDDVEGLVGLGFETHFGEFEDDTVYICNNGLETYYEILRDYGKYSDLQVGE